MVLKEPIMIDNANSLILTQDEFNQFNCTPKDFQVDRSDTRSKGYESSYEQMNTHLRRRAKGNDQASATYVMYSSKRGKIIGYYTIAMGTTKLSKKFRQSSQIEGHDGNIGYPCVDVPFLAIDVDFQHEGYGALLLEHLLLNVYWQVIPVIGADLIRLDAVDKAKGFYEKYGFLPYAQDHLKKRLIPMGLSTGSISDILKLNGEASEEEENVRTMLENTLLLFQ